MALSIGSKAPNFSLYNSDKTKTTLSDYTSNGKNVIVLFFPAAYTGVCTEELCTMRDDIEKYDELDAQILAISVDTPFTLAKFKEAQGYNFPLLSDFNKQTIRDYDTYMNEFVMELKGVAKRAAYIVNPDMQVVYAEVLEDPGQQPDYDAIKEKLRQMN